MEDWRAGVIDAFFFRIGEDLSTPLMNTFGRHRDDLQKQG
jgi:hypothetical protein